MVKLKQEVFIMKKNDKKAKTKKSGLPALVCMIVVGTNPLAIIFAAEGLAAAHRQRK
jgi:hypothetical protein